MGFSIRRALFAVLVVASCCLGPSALSSDARRASAERPAGLVTRAELLTRQVRSLAESLQAQSLRQDELARLADLSQQRRHALILLASRRPRRAATLVLPPAVRHMLHAVPGAAVESSVVLSGTFRVSHSDSAEHPALSVYLDQIVTSSGKALTLHGADAHTAVRLAFARLKPGGSMSVRGFALGGHVLATEVSTTGTRRFMSAARSAGAAAATGPIATAVIVATFADSTATVDMNAVRATFQGNPGRDAVSYFSEASYGKMTLVPSFYGPYTLATPASTGCSSRPTQALIEAAAANVSFGQFSRLIFVYNCPGASFGSATSVGPVSTPQGTVQAAQITLDARSATELYSVVHELSHTLGGFNQHAASYICLPDTLAVEGRYDPGCVSSEYGDAFDVLGGPPTGWVAQLNPYHKANAGWFGSGQFPTVSTPGTYTYTLAPYEQPSSGVLALNIPRGSSGTSFTVEYRQPLGYDAWMGSPAVCWTCTATQGASIRLVSSRAGGGGGSDTQLLDTTPGTIGSTSYYPVEDGRDGALLPGRTFTDPEYRISITTVSAAPSGLTVRVTVPTQSCERGTPTVGAPSPASQTATAGGTGVYTFTLTNTDSSGCQPNTFRYVPPSSTSLALVASPDFVTLEPGASETISLRVSAVPLTTTGGFGFSTSDGVGAGVFRSNSLGTDGAIVAGLSFTLGAAADTTVPTVPTGVTATALGARAVSLSWTPSSDNVGVVGYRVTRSGALLTTGDTTLADSGLTPGTAYSYSVQAFDRRGNLSPSTTVSVTTPAKTDVAAPTPPTVTAEAGDHSLSVSWTGSTDDVGIAYYRIVPCLVPRCLVPASAHSFTVGGLPSRTRYDVQVLAVDGDGNASDAGSGTYPVYTAAANTMAPSQPQRFVSPTGSYGRVELAWAPSTDDRGVAQYNVYRNNRQIATVTSPAYADVAVGAPSEYYVQAVDEDGSLSAPSARVWFPAPYSSSSDTAPPTASVSWPASGSTLSGTVAVTPSTSDDVRVTNVQLYVDGLLRGNSTSAPFSLPWDTSSVRDGAHWLYVRAFDAAGNWRSSELVSVTTSNGRTDTMLPSVSILSPLTGSLASASVSVSASAVDSLGVTGVHFSVDGRQLGSSTNAPYGFTWDALDSGPGSHTITATAYNAVGNAATATVIVMRPVAADATPPAVSISAPANGATVSGTTQVLASASDNLGVAKVEFSVDGSLKGSVAAAPWSFALDTSPLSAGTHTLGVKAYDAAGNSSIAQVTISVAPPPPTDTAPPTAPSSLRATVVGTTELAVTWAAAKDNVGVVAYVVSRDGVEIGETPVPAFLDSGLAPPSSHTYRVVARDAAGNRSPASSALTAKTAAISTASTVTLSGLVYTPLGKPLANTVVQVTINGTVKSAKTNNSGLYKLTGLPTGSYTVTIAPAGYQMTTTAVSGLAGRTVVLVTVLSL